MRLLIKHRLAFLFCLVATVLLIVTRVGAEGDSRKIGLRISGDTLYATFGFQDVFSKKVRKKLNSGLPSKTLVQVVLKSKKGKSLAYFARSVEIVYDLWEENYSITVQDNDGRRRTTVNSVEKAINIAGVLWHAPIARNIAGLPPGSYRLQVIVEANPVSDEMIRNIQRWISRPKGTYGDSETRSNFFGSFVGHFVDRGIGEADKTVTFNSQWFSLGEEGGK